ncbi:hypothetical protein BDW69DRAFT_184947 [Aspergillus filifer]
MPYYRRRRSTAYRLRLESTPMTCECPYPDPWSHLPLFPSAGQISSALQARTTPPPPHDIHSHIKSTYTNGVEPSIHVIPDIMESVSDAIRTRQVTKAMESLKLIEKWVPRRAKLAVLHEMICHAIIVSNSEIVNRILEGHGFSTVFFEEPMRLAASVRPVEILESLLRGMIRHAEVNKLGIARALQFNPTDEIVGLQVEMNIAGVVASALHESTSEEASRVLGVLLAAFLGEGEYHPCNVPCPIDAFQMKAGQIYNSWPLRLCRKLSNASLSESGMPPICEEALSMRLRNDTRCTGGFNTMTCQYEWYTKESNKI